MKTTKIKWYEKILLMFCKTNISVDIENDVTAKCYLKKLFGKTFIVDIEIKKVEP